MCLKCFSLTKLGPGNEKIESPPAYDVDENVQVNQSTPSSDPDCTTKGLIDKVNIISTEPLI